MAIMSVLAGCFHPPSEAARGARSQQRKAERRRYEAEKRRWVEEQVALHLAAMYTYDGGRGGSVDVSRYGGIKHQPGAGPLLRVRPQVEIRSDHAPARPGGWNDERRRRQVIPSILSSFQIVDVLGCELKDANS
uniref:Uncharacterized protein n=1 Tax=Oryza brachyantha TaxID=4533 RepID=J3N778_ORYBR